VEDLLQDNVKECITDFRDAGMKVWMLTGDKGLTAKEIAYSCGLLVKLKEDFGDLGDIQLTEKSISTNQRTVFDE
jgi:phospholipid-translocating ATPase